MVDVVGEIVHSYMTDQLQPPALEEGKESPKAKARINVIKVVHIVDVVVRLVVRDQGRSDTRVRVLTDRASVGVLHERSLLPDHHIARPQIAVYVHQGKAQLPVDPLATNRSDSRARSGASTS